MSLRLPLIGIAVVLALGVSIYLGLQAGAPDAAAKTSLPIAIPKSEPNKKANALSIKGTPPPFPMMEDSFPASAPAAPVAAAAPQMDQQQIMAALKKLEVLSDGPDKHKRRQELLALFVALDPITALSYVETLTGEEHALQKTAALGVWAEKNPAAAASYFKENGLPGGIASDEDRNSAAAIAKAWAAQDTAAAWSWVATLPEDARGQATAEVVTRMAERDPQAALHAVQSLITDYERAEAMQPLADQWARSAPVVAAAWVSALRDEAQQSYAASGLVTGWMATSPRAASEWVAQLSPGNARDSAIVSMVQAPTAQKSPEAALTWAANIQNEELRNQILPQVMREWQARDPVAAEKWLSKHR